MIVTSSIIQPAAPRDGQMCHSQTVSETKVQNLASQTDLSAQGQPALSKGFCSLPGNIIHWKWPLRAFVTYVSICERFLYVTRGPKLKGFLQDASSRTFNFKSALVGLNSGLQAGYLCWMKCVWIYEWRSYHRSNCPLGSKAGRRESFGNGGRMLSERVHGVYDVLYPDLSA